MPVPSDLKSPIKDIVHQLVLGDFGQLEKDHRSGRCSAQGLRDAIKRYGRTLVDIPDEAFELADTMAIEGKQSEWAIDLPLWTSQEGRSDLTLQLLARSSPKGAWVEITDLLVM